MRLRPLLFLWLLCPSLTGLGQDFRFGLGTDPALWMTGWRNAQVGWQFHEEATVVIGAGWMTDGAPALDLLRPRPTSFNQAVMGSLGLRFHPQPVGTSRMTGLVGLDLSQEVFQMQVESGVLQDGVAVPLGVRQFHRSDIRMLAGARARLGEAYTLSAHASVGYVIDRDAAWDRSAIPQGAPPVSRILALELMRWF